MAGLLLSACTSPENNIISPPKKPDFTWQCPDGSTTLNLYFNGLNITPNQQAFDEEFKDLCKPKNPKITMPIIFNPNEPTNNSPDLGHSNDEIFVDRLTGQTYARIKSFTIEMRNIYQYQNIFETQNQVLIPSRYQSTDQMLSFTNVESLFNYTVRHEIDHAMRYFENITADNMRGTEGPVFYDGTTYYNKIMKNKAKQLLFCSEPTCMAKTP